MKTSLHLFLFTTLLATSLSSQPREWIMPLPGDPAISTSYHGNINSWQTQDYLCWSPIIYGTEPRPLHLFNGTQWKTIMTDSLLATSITHLDAQNDSLVTLTLVSYRYDALVQLYDGKSWKKLEKLSDIRGAHKNFNDMGVIELKFFRNKLYALVSDDDFNSSLMEYDFKTDALNKVASFRQNKTNEIYNQQNKVGMYVYNNRLYVFGAYDYADNASCEGFGYYDGASFVPMSIFPTSVTDNCTFVRRLDHNTFIVQRAILNYLNPTTKYRMYIMKDDSLIKDVTGDLFSNYRTSYNLISQSTDNMHVMMLNGKLLYFDEYSDEPVMEYDAAVNKWLPIEMKFFDGHSYWFRNKRYLFSGWITVPYTNTGRSCFIVRNAWSVSGTAYLDNDNDCQRTSDDSVIRKTWISLGNSSLSMSFLTNADGQYEMPVEIGTFVYSASHPSLTFGKCKNDTLVVDSMKNYYQDISRSFAPPYDSKGDPAIMLFGSTMRRGRNYTLTIELENNGSKDMNVTPVLTFDNRMSFVSASSAISSQSGNRIVFATQKARFYDKTKITVLFFGDPKDINVDDKINFEASIDSSDAEVDHANNISKYTETVLGPFDPNHITGNPGKKVSHSPKDIFYTIEFQNIGNDTAFNVRITDEIPASLDLKTLKVLDHSGPSVDALVIGSKIEFSFRDIMLSPSALNEAGSKGFVTFVISLKDTMTIGQVINNKADIYFDFEDAIVTNTASVTRTRNSSIVAHQSSNLPFSIYPNPGNGMVKLLLKDGFSLSGLRIYNTTGQQVYSSCDGTTDLDISALPAGMYMLNISLNNSNYTCIYNKLD
jgi:hypothetical protein